MGKVLCVGIAAVNISAFPVTPSIVENETTLVESIGLTTGGDAVNQSIILSRLGNEVKLATKMGDDDYGAFMKKSLAESGVDVSTIAIDTDKGTSSCIVLIQKSGSRSFLVDKGAIKAFSFEDIPSYAVSQADVVSIGGLFALPAFDREGAYQLFKKAKASGCITVADTKYDAFKIGYQAIRPMLSYTDYFMPSFNEAAYLSGKSEPEAMARAFLEDGAKNVVIKLGGNGCLAMNGQEKHFVPSFEVPVIDTTGAGDNFTASFIHGLLRGWPLKDCALFGNAAGAVCVSQVGATSALTGIDLIKETLSANDSGHYLLSAI